MFFVCAKWASPCDNGAPGACARSCIYEHEAIHASDCEAQDGAYPDPGTYRIDTECRAYWASLACLDRLLGRQSPVSAPGSGEKVSDTHNRE
jgi:hypothetical protein